MHGALMLTHTTRFMSLLDEAQFEAGGSLLLVIEIHETEL